MTQRDRTVLLVVLVLGILGGYWFLALKPKREEVSAADARIAKAQGQLSSADATLSAAREAKASYPKNYATVANLGKAVPVAGQRRVQVDGVRHHGGAEHAGRQQHRLGTLEAGHDARHRGTPVDVADHQAGTEADGDHR